MLTYIPTDGPTEIRTYLHACPDLSAWRAQTKHISKYMREIHQSMHACIHVHTDTHSHMHTYIYIDRRTYIHTYYIYAYIHIHTHTDIDRQTDRQTYIVTD